VFPVAISDRSERNVARRVRRFVRQLEPYSLTPYLFCPIGFDFVLPIRDLVSLLDRYNEVRYPTTGVWALNAGLGDYLDLVNCYRDQLPVIELDPNPYWTGFYSSRPALKKRCHVLVNELRLAEKLSHLPENSESAQRLHHDLEEAWWTAATANHHDFITGTSPDRVVDAEQVPWLEGALQVSSEKIKQLAPQALNGRTTQRVANLPDWFRRDGQITVQTPYYTVVLSEEAGGSILRIEDPRSGAVLLDGPSNDLISFKDSGGLWRMGYEFSGGIWSQRDRAAEHPAAVQVAEAHGGLQVSWVSTLDGEELRRDMWFGGHSPLIYCRLRGRAPKRRTVTASFLTRMSSDRLLMDTPGGVVSRPREKVYSPTFWPLQRFLHIRDRGSERGLAFYQQLPGAASLASNGELQVVALRNAPRERQHHVFPVPGNPAKGYERDAFSFVYALEFTAAGDWIENKLAQKAYGGELNPWVDPAHARLGRLAEEQIHVDRPDVWVIANKPATRGRGRIVRLYTLAAAHQEAGLSIPHQEIREAYLCDARERDIRRLEVRDGRVQVTLPGTIASVRLIAASAGDG
jgi:hypothetical protein